MSKIDGSLFDADRQALEQAYGDCPDCGRALALKRGKKGPFIGCSQYPQCDFTKPLHEYQDSLVKVIDGSRCPLCSAELAIKKGRYGLFIGCSNFPQCHHIAALNNDTQIETIDCPSCAAGQLIKRTNKFGKNFYACDAYPKCRFLTNQKPIAGHCEKCHFPLLEKRGDKVRCADKQCQHTQAEC